MIRQLAILFFCSLLSVSVAAANLKPGAVAASRSSISPACLGCAVHHAVAPGAVFIYRHIRMAAVGGVAGGHELGLV